MTTNDARRGEYRVRFTYRLGLVIRLLPVLVAGWFVVWGPWSTLEGLSTFVTALRSIAPLFFWLLAASFLWAVTLLRPTRAAIDGSKLVLPAGSSFRSTTIRLEDIETATLDSAGELTIARASGRRIVFDTAMPVDPGRFVADLVTVLGDRRAEERDVRRYALTWCLLLSPRPLFARGGVVCKQGRGCGGQLRLSGKISDGIVITEPSDLQLSAAPKLEQIGL